MCGLFGVASSMVSVDTDRANISLDALTHRGPDGRGVWYTNKVFSGHRRLSILDLSSSGTQPMIASGVIITVNGEIYNYRDLRDELGSEYDFFSDSDSEVVLHGYRAWGIEKLLLKLDGMFALSIYDQNTDSIYLARDRVGIKPLYFSELNGALTWSSEIGPICSYHRLDADKLRSDAVLDFLTYRFVPAPKTIYIGVNKLSPGRYIEYELRTNKISEHTYWQLPEASSGVADTEGLECFMVDACAEQLMSDVPVGLLLSGGIDSSVIAALTVQKKNLPSFSIGFEDRQYDESELISIIARHLGLTSRIKTLGLSDTNTLMKNLAVWFEDPIADMSAIPTSAVCQLARDYVTVCLSGDGADEMFFGYPRYFNRKVHISGGTSVIVKNLLGWLKSRLGWSFFGRVVRYIEQKFFLNGMDLFCVVSGGIHPNETALIAKELSVSEDYDRFWLYRHFGLDKRCTPDLLRRFEFQTVLPEMLLAKVDRVSMGNSLEVRLPYLGNNIVNYAFTASVESLLAEAGTKPLLRSVAARYLPEAITQGKKRGFGLPPNLRKSASGKRSSLQRRFMELSPLLKKYLVTVK